MVNCGYIFLIAVNVDNRMALMTRPKGKACLSGGLTH